ncbi:YncE family protein [Lysinibacillus pakistanensis]|uniref:YncE family protein n=1 Tax=Lysinibacillus pakistanensis TaxID=759811 RepID=A0AAX3WWV4_9BACI|nr:YncE family protein [Lysinibacillus pakistanensis]MDM5230289.1 YncE family protein [Lysinibacillus pakistanensis]WHY45875.1 YncE family protein [Lysinibacillus pakistanensis]WHY50887.1 YncE family protein [Lysinibacillus pakistanensis]
MMLKRIAFFILSLLLVVWLAGCKELSFKPIKSKQNFIASLNIQEPSLDFIDEQGKVIATWLFDKAYTGAVLLGDNRILLFGHQLDKIDVYTLSTGEKLYSKKVKMGTTNVYYSENDKQFFITNSTTNTVTSFDEKGNELASQQLGNYPMSMVAFKEKLYIINFKDTKLSILNVKNLKVEQEWVIPKSAHGLAIIEETNELWVGGHGDGSKPNSSVKRYDLATGELQGEIEMPLMPVGLTKTKDSVLVISHGHNELYVADFNGKVKWQLEVGANPFVVDQFKNYIVVAGYDDHTLYFIKDGHVEKTVDVGKGAFQLLVREEKL